MFLPIFVFADCYRYFVDFLCFAGFCQENRLVLLFVSDNVRMGRERAAGGTA
jgi:hypothetical protein